MAGFLSSALCELAPHGVEDPDVRTLLGMPGDASAGIKNPLFLRRGASPQKESVSAFQKSQFASIFRK